MEVRALRTIAFTNQRTAVDAMCTPSADLDTIGHRLHASEFIMAGLALNGGFFNRDPHRIV
jgi:hypothetical protein